MTITPKELAFLVDQLEKRFKYENQLRVDIFEIQTKNPEPNLALLVKFSKHQAKDWKVPRSTDHICQQKPWHCKNRKHRKISARQHHI